MDQDQFTNLAAFDKAIADAGYAIVLTSDWMEAKKALEEKRAAKPPEPEPPKHDTDALDMLNRMLVAVTQSGVSLRKPDVVNSKRSSACLSWFGPGEFGPGDSVDLMWYQKPSKTGLTTAFEISRGRSFRAGHASLDAAITHLSAFPECIL